MNWPTVDPPDASTLLPLPPSPSSVSNDSYESAFSSSQHTAVLQAACAKASASSSASGLAAAAATAAADDADDVNASKPAAAVVTAPVDMPCRPRTAYIFFTKAKREKIRKELEAKKGGKLSAGPKVMGKSGKVCV